MSVGESVCLCRCVDVCVTVSVGGEHVWGMSGWAVGACVSVHVCACMRAGCYLGLERIVNEPVGWTAERMGEGLLLPAWRARASPHPRLRHRSRSSEQQTTSQVSLTHPVPAGGSSGTRVKHRCPASHPVTWHRPPAPPPRPGILAAAGVGITVPRAAGAGGCGRRASEACSARPPARAPPPRATGTEAWSAGWVRPRIGCGTGSSPRC